MPDSETAAPAAPPAEEQAPSAPAPAEETADQSEPPDGNNWLRETAQGLIYSRPLDTAQRSKELDEARAELRRGRRNKGTEGDAPKAEREPDAPNEAEPEPEPPSSPRESRDGDDQEFQRKVQAEVDRREAVRRQREAAQQERTLRQQDPTAYARLKEQQEAQAASATSLTNALQTLSRQFDDATVTPLMQALASDDIRNEVLKDAGHGLPGRKEIVTRALKALKKAAYDEGLAKGKETAQKSLRRSSAFRKELLSELRGEEDEPEVALGNGTAGSGEDWDMNDWMRGQVFGRGRPAARNGR
jgi:hypothetical protein